MTMWMPMGRVVAMKKKMIFLRMRMMLTIRGSAISLLLMLECCYRRPHVEFWSPKIGLLRLRTASCKTMKTRLLHRYW